MKRTVPLLFICCTVLATAAGFLLPGFLSAAQDSGIQTKEYAYETDSIQFHPVARFEDSLQLLNGDGRTTMNFFPKDNGKLGADGAHQAALEFLRFLETNGMPGIVDSYSTHTETAFLVVSADSTKSAVFWECEFYHVEGGDFVHILIDDNTGKMLAFKVETGHRMIWGREGENNLKQAMVSLAKISSLYFGWKYEKFYMESVSKGTITLINQSGNALLFPVQISDDAYTFNGALLFRKVGG